MILHGTDSSGRDLNNYSLLSFTCFTALILVVSGQIMLDTAYWTVFSHIVIWGSLLVYFGIAIFLYEVLPAQLMAKGATSQSYGIVFQAFACPQFWISLIMICVILLLPVVVNRFFWFDTHPSYADRLRVRHKLKKELPSEKTVRLRPFASGTIKRRSRRGSLRSGYAFSHQQGFGELILKGKLFSSQPKQKSTISPICENPIGLIAATSLLHNKSLDEESEPSKKKDDDNLETQSESQQIFESPVSPDSNVAYQHNILIDPESAEDYCDTTLETEASAVSEQQPTETTLDAQQITPFEEYSQSGQSSLTRSTITYDLPNIPSLSSLPESHTIVKVVTPQERPKIWSSSNGGVTETSFVRKRSGDPQNSECDSKSTINPIVERF
ncbi:hypothetical protein AB6A40_008610 [Gnathostoma spinigerum]|uniref:P-type ATPase C-terminal domain-containing protein n=1 Tax=Gnathostoma spinigerum TaxID=75299 RepID=A0ABD6ERF9_9BILA